MEQIILDHGSRLLWHFLIWGFLLIGLWESFRPRRRTVASTPRRWFASVALEVTNMALMRLLIPALTLNIAISAQHHGYGLFNHTTLALAIELPMAVMLLDLLHYCLHFAMHRSPWLWRMHMVHHADVDFDCSTQLRFHPLEAFLSQGVLLAGVLVIGASPAALLIYYLASIANGYFSHGNIALPAAAERVLRRVLVTPDMHRIHHSSALQESNRNFSALLPWWDKLFGTYRAEPAGGHTGMALGLTEYRDARALGFLSLLRMPFVRLPRPAEPVSSEAGAEAVPAANLANLGQPPFQPRNERSSKET
jgi:sterol desaturase/sphingolipid hydroxylase (fatty acid hydroxylase superfamily)